MPEPIRFSVIIPAYNAEQSIVASVQSCLNQTRPAFEIIVVDDGSSDETVELLKDRFGNRIRLLESEKNQGPSVARNRGVLAASGTHIAFQDADDFWHPQKLELLETVLIKNPVIHFLFHRFTLKPLDNGFSLGAQTLKKYPFWKMLLRNPVATPCSIIKKEIVEPFNEQMHHTEDYDLFLRLAQKHGLYLFDSPLTQLGRPVLSKGGQSEQRLKMRMGEWQAWRNLCRQAPKYFLLLPFLIAWSILKHLIKSATQILQPREVSTF